MLNKKFLKKISEGDTEVFVYKTKESKKGPGSKIVGPFYNPSMELNRDLSVLFSQNFINKFDKKVELLDGFGASGIRGVRFCNELDGDFKVFINDWDEKAYDLIIKNLKHVGCLNVEVFNKNVNTLLSERSFDYIDIDPFGSPVSFVDSAARSVRNNGVICCTATDTATLCGVYQKACVRRYGGFPLHGAVMKEVGIRILLGFLCREICKYDKDMKPLVCYATDHYFRIYVRVTKGAKSANKSLENIDLIRSGEHVGYEKIKKDIGPLWLGSIQDKDYIRELRTILSEKDFGTKKQLWKLFDLLEEEADLPMFFYTTDDLSSKFKKSPPKLKEVFGKLREKGYIVSRTHFTPTGFKTDASFDIIEKMFK